jgi:tRNA pseudouridine38-40 synthase
MPSRLKLIVAYDGGPFAGWQSQPNRNGIQDHIEAAFTRVSGEQVRVHGAGRTDAGVHALAQCAHVDLVSRRFEPAKWLEALNGVLPPTIRIMRAGFVADSFHARFSARQKEYRYRIWNADVLPPLEAGRVWHLRSPLDVGAMQRAAKDLLGRHDFRSFSANRGTPVDDTFRTVSSAIVRRSGPLITVSLQAEGFLYKMARLITGALVHVGSGRTEVGEIRSRLHDPQRTKGSARNVAPAAGLFLVRVRY